MARTGTQATTRDDALNFAGANVWIDAAPGGNVPTVDVVSGFAHMNYQGIDWFLVRHDGIAGNGWHPANDNLAGSASYGDLGTDPTDGTEWSVPFGSDFTQYLLASGDLSMWVQIGRDELASRCAASCAACAMDLVGSSTGGAAVAQYCRTGASGGSLDQRWRSPNAHRLR